MILLRKPSPAVIREFLHAQAGLGLTYPAGRASADAPPAGYVVDHTRVRLGAGEAVFAAARAALARWEQFRLGWLQVWPEGVPLREGEVVAVLARALGLWSLNACRVVSVLDEEGPVRAFGFAYGTLPDHAATGEERFLVEWDREDGGVWYDIRAISRPRHLLARLGYPLVRRLQKRFGRDSAAAMRRAVAPRGPAP
jgi:uncharacterized protein (UPF0548 family)